MLNRRWLVGLMVALPRIALGQPVGVERPSAAALPATADEQLYRCKTHTGAVAVTFKPETDIKDLLTWVMGFTCKNFILDPRISSTGRKLTVIAPNKLSAREAYQVFLVALSTIGLTVVAKGSVMRIVEAGAAKKEALPIYNHAPGTGDDVVRVVLRPSYTQTDTLKQAFAALKSDAGDITTVGSMLVITDFASTISAMMGLKKLVDVPSGSDGIYTIPIRHGDAAKVAQVLTSMFGVAPTAIAAPGKPPSEPAVAGEPVPSKIVVDERTNTLVLSASEPAYQRAKALVERIDVAIDIGGAGSIHTYQLASAIAEELAQTLTRAITGDTSPSRAQRTGAPTTGQPTPPPASAALDGLGATLQGTVHIVPDKATNKLLITASSRDFAALKDVIRELDQPRRQVYIEAMILEVDVSNNLSFGASAHAASSVSGGVAVGGVQLPGLSSAAPATALDAGGVIAGLIGDVLPGSSLLGTSFPSYGLLIQALANRNTTDVLSMPSLIAVDNEETKSKIGENIPFIRGVVPATTSATTTLTTNIDRQPLELELNIKPHISAGDTVLLEIKHSAGGVKSQSDALGPTWTTRAVETRVVVRDQETVLIGGLLQDSTQKTESKVPILGDIPLLGYLFRYTENVKRKTNLLIMLTPYIIRDQSDLQLIRQRKLRQNDEFFRSFANLDGMKLDPEVNYHRKRGLIEEINRAILGSEADQAARAEAPAPRGVAAGPVEPSDASDSDAAGSDAPSSDEAAPPSKATPAPPPAER